MELTFSSPNSARVESSVNIEGGISRSILSGIKEKLKNIENLVQAKLEIAICL